jgi:predicted KAP-like P-loop ATPase
LLDLVAQPLIGSLMARLAQARDNLGQAQEYIAEILDLLQTAAPGATLSTFEPFRVYLTCYHLLAANQDERASSILQTAYRLLQERATQITDEKLRRSFLENVPEHREIVAAYRAVYRRLSLK